MGVGAAKSHLSGVIREVEARGDRIVIERRGRPVAVLVPYEPLVEEVARPHWADALRGISGHVPDFDRTMREVLASRRRQRPRPVRAFE
ncbi:MAG: type II toxin-antitoxin system Phd/YefM family antitoxin [Deltaproteobacteria bacterium]|nr:type II toxin-antitoxin system Phd/YefM family antitoxin [Deltaproteobacteria bacterium]